MQTLLLLLFLELLHALQRRVTLSRRLHMPSALLCQLSLSEVVRACVCVTLSFIT